MAFKSESSKIQYVRRISHNANCSEMRTSHRRARHPEDPRFDCGYDAMFSLFVVGALTDFSKTATRIRNDDLALPNTRLNSPTPGTQFILDAHPSLKSVPRMCLPLYSSSEKFGSTHSPSFRESGESLRIPIETTPKEWQEALDKFHRRLTLLLAS
jgi:hypothetical protein